MLGHLQRPDPKRTQTKSDTQWPDHRDSTAHRDAGSWSTQWLLQAAGCGVFIQLLCFESVCQRRQWHPTPVLLPEKSHGWRSLSSMGSLRVGYD